MTNLKPPLHKGCECTVVRGELTDIRKPDIVISDAQFGKKAGKHMEDWGLSAASPDDREAFSALIRDIVRTADEVRSVQWLENANHERKVEVYAFIKGEDVVLLQKSREFLTILKNAKSTSTRIREGKVIYESRPEIP